MTKAKSVSRPKKHPAVIACYLILAVTIGLSIPVYVVTMLLAIHERTMTAYSAVFLTVFGGAYLLVRCIDQITPGFPHRASTCSRCRRPLRRS